MQKFYRMSLVVALAAGLLLGVRAQEAARELTLSDAIALALAHNPALLNAQGQAAAAHAQVNKSRSAELPHAQLSTSDTYTTPVPTFQITPLAPPIALAQQQCLDCQSGSERGHLFRRALAALVRQATDNAHAVEATNARTSQEVAFNAEHAFSTCSPRSVPLSWRRTIAGHRASAPERRAGPVRSGAAPRFDVLRAQVDVETAQQGVVQADANIQVAQAALLEALGLHDQTFIAADPGLDPNAPIAPLDALLQQARTGRPSCAHSAGSIRLR